MSELRCSSHFQDDLRPCCLDIPPRKASIYHTEILLPDMGCHRLHVEQVANTIVLENRFTSIIMGRNNKPTLECW